MMPFYQTSEQLYSSLRALFGRLQENNSGAARTVTQARMAIRLRCTSPEAVVLIDGRQPAVQIRFGESSFRPDLDVEVTSDALHAILLADLPLRKALASGQLKVRGAIWKTFALEEILRQGQSLYPRVLREQNPFNSP